MAGIKPGWAASAILATMTVVLFSQSALARASSLPIDDSTSNVVITIFPLEDHGAHSYYNVGKRQILLPGAGTGNAAVCVYTAPDGEQWYVDKTGTRQSLPSTHSQGKPVAAVHGSYEDPNYNFGYEYHQQPPITMNTSSGGMAQTASGLGEGVSSSVTTRQVPWETLIYWGEGHPWYYGADGAAVHVSASQFGLYNEWMRQNNYWLNSAHGTHWTGNNCFKQNYSGKNWGNGNMNDHWGQHGWPGKDHGYPPPHDQAHQRMYIYG